METLLMGTGALVVVGVVIRSLAKAIRDSGLQKITFSLKFKTNEKPPKQLNH